MPEYRLRPFGSSFLGGVNIALGDVDGDGMNDLIAAQSRGSTVASLFEVILRVVGRQVRFVVTHRMDQHILLV